MHTRRNPSISRSARWERRPEQRPDEILDAALQVFAHRGYRATRLDEIARACGVTKGTIYHYFQGKEHLLLAAVRQRRERIFAQARAVIADGRDSARTRLIRLQQDCWRRWSDPQSRQVLRLMLSDVSVEAPRVFREWLKEGFLVGLGMVTDLIEEGKSKGEFRADVDAEVAARVFLSGMLLQMLLHYDMGLNELAPMSLDRLVQGSLDLLMNGLT